jgi:hypothetical protein
VSATARIAVGQALLGKGVTVKLSPQRTYTVGPPRSSGADRQTLTVAPGRRNAWVRPG